MSEATEYLLLRTEQFYAKYLMNSNSISDYVDSQSRQSTMQAQMQKTIDSIMP